MSAAAALYWIAMLVPSLAIFSLTHEIGNRPGDGPYTVKALLSIARGAAFPVGFIITLSGPVRRAVTATAWRRAAALAVLPLLYSVMPNLAFALARHDVPALLTARFLGTMVISAAFCAYLACVQGRRASDITMPIVTLAMLLCPAISRPLAHEVAHYLGPDMLEWMPAAVSALCAIPVIVGAGLLIAAPARTEADARARSPRPPSSRTADRAWLARNWPALLGLALSNTALQGMGAVRDVFTADLLGENAPWWHSLLADVPACVGACLLYMPLLVVNDNRRVFLGINAVGIAAAVVVVSSGVLLLGGMLSPLLFMVMSGVGYFVALVPFSGGGIVFERLVASTRTPVDAVLVNVVCQIPAYIGGLGVLLMAPVASHAHAFFGWTSLVGGGVLIATFAWTLCMGHVVLPPTFPIDLSRRGSMAYLGLPSRLLRGDQDGLVARSGSLNDDSECPDFYRPAPAGTIVPS